MLLKNINNKKCTPKFIYNLQWQKKSERFGWFCHFLYQSQNLTISFDYSWSLAKILSNFVSLPWKLHNRYCHTVDQTIDKIEVSSSWLTIEYYFWRIILGSDHEEGSSSTSELQQISSRHFHEKKGKGML